MNVGGPLFDGLGGNGGKSYHCLYCGMAVSTSDRILEVDGRIRHLFVNPAGMRCELLTFIACPGASVLGDPTLAHTWFRGYSWRLALCSRCGAHLGWHYRAHSDLRPLEFWGLLVAHLAARHGSPRIPLSHLGQARGPNSDMGKP